MIGSPAMDPRFAHGIPHGYAASFGSGFNMNALHPSPFAAQIPRSSATAVNDQRYSELLSSPASMVQGYPVPPSPVLLYPASSHSRRAAFGGGLTPLPPQYERVSRSRAKHRVSQTNPGAPHPQPSSENLDARHRCHRHKKPHRSSHASRSAPDSTASAQAKAAASTSTIAPAQDTAQRQPDASLPHENTSAAQVPPVDASDHNRQLCTSKPSTKRKAVDKAASSAEAKRQKQPSVPDKPATEAPIEDADPAPAVVSRQAQQSSSPVPRCLRQEPVTPQLPPLPGNSALRRTLPRTSQAVLFGPLPVSDDLDSDDLSPIFQCDHGFNNFVECHLMLFLHRHMPLKNVPERVTLGCPKHTHRIALHKALFLGRNMDDFLDWRFKGGVEAFRIRQTVEWTRMSPADLTRFANEGYRKILKHTCSNGAWCRRLDHLFLGKR
ncbi:hypothetical protein PG985_007926 [Apiospora marii]|uniref:uncharacterized protein n=1 Tax=Apiospora marii TaxID=335849 RepID=UPI00312DCB92